MAPFGRLICNEEELALSMQGTPAISFLRVERRALTFREIACHKTSAQALVALGGLASVFVLARPDRQTGLPDLQSMKALLIDGDRGVLIHPGIWHYGPVPLASHAIYANVEALGTNQDDFHRADLGSELGFQIKIEL